MSTLPAVLLALAEHADVIDLLIRALTGGAIKDELTRAIEAAMVAASDAAMHEELSVVEGHHG
jgi:hypothetical protein